MERSPDDYRFRSSRVDLMDLIPDGCRVALDVGCSVGVTGAWLKEHRGVAEVVGMEIIESAAKEAESVLDRVVVGDVEDVELDVGDEYFDLILYADVLEHLRNPWEFMKRQSSLLKSDGYVAVSLPNIANWHVIKGLLFNKWEYADSGIMDRGHLRFFTLPGMLEMFDYAGYDVAIQRRNRGKISELIGRMTFEALGHFVTFQYLFLLRKKK